jgi:hypothetical protein
MNRSASASGLRDWTARIRRSVSVTVRPRAAPVPGAAVVGEGATGMTVTVSPVAVLAALPSPTVPAPPSTPTTASAVTTQTEDGRLDSTGLNDAQAVLARKRAIKLGRLFGDRPPPALYLPSVVSPTGATGPCSSSSSETVSGAGTGTGTGTGTRLAPSPVYASFAQSLSSLLYLAEHDAEGLALAMDEIDIEASESEEESGSENEVVTMEAALRDRASRRASAPPSSLLFPSVAKATLAPTPVPEAEAGATATAPKPKPKPAHTRHISLSTRKAFLANLFADPFGDAAAAANQTAQPAPAPETPNAHAFTHTTLSTPAQRTKASRHISRPSLHVALAPPTDVAREQAQASPLAPSFHGDGASIGAARASTVAPYTPASAAFSASSVPPTPGVPVSVASTPTTPFTRWQPIIAHAYSRAPPAPPVTPVTPVTPATPGTPATRSTPATPGTPASPAQAARRRETLDGVLRAMWSSVESEVGRGGVAPPERDALGSLMGELRRKGSEWAEV